MLNGAMSHNRAEEVSSPESTILRCGSKVPGELALVLSDVQVHSSG